MIISLGLTVRGFDKLSIFLATVMQARPYTALFKTERNQRPVVLLI